MSEPRDEADLVRERAGELDALWWRLQRTGGCRQPIRLIGHSRDGGYDTTDEPDGVLLVACGTRRKSRCPSCAAIYRGDARQVVIAGLAGGKGVPETVAEHPAVFFTLTGPSFGAVHSARSGACHLGPPGRCPHGRERHCLDRHADDDDLVGTPLCPDCFDYEGCVLFNATVSELWRRVSIYAFRHLAYAMGTSEPQLRKRVRLSYVKCVEFQRRGVVHLHGLLRADAAGDELAPPAGVTAQLLAQALVAAVQAVRVTRTFGGRSVVLAFGGQLRVDPVGGADASRIASYVSKYTVKSVEESGALDRRLREGHLVTLDLPDHVRRLVETAFALGRSEEHAACGRWAHMFGFAGHVLTKSRRFSTTFGALRRARRAWRSEEAGEEESTGTTAWRFGGVGLRLELDRRLARGIEERRQESRREAWLALHLGEVGVAS
jgi:hypothetical protein